MDWWFHTKDDTSREPAPKPKMVRSPHAPLLDELQSRNVTGWLSIGATLLSGTSDVQETLARYGEELLDNPSPTGQGRSIAIPITGSVDPAEGWLFVWATRPAGEDPASAEKRIRTYLRAKKHQLSLPRGVVLLYDEPTRDLVGVYYDGHIGPPDAEVSAALGYLRSASDFQRLNSNARLPSRSIKSTSKAKTNRKHR